MTLLMQDIQSDQIHRDRTRSGGCKGCESERVAGRGSWCSVGAVSVVQDEKVVEMDGHGGCTKM
jgi:hypothetical protein